MDETMLDYIDKLGERIGSDKTATTIKGCIKLVSYLDRFTEEDVLTVLDKKNDKEINVLFKA